MRESLIQSKVVEYALMKGIIARKLNFGEGWPDYMFLYGGLTLFIEFKATGEKPEPLQLYMHERIRNRSFQVEVVDNPDVGRQLIKEFYDRGNRHVAALRGSHDKDK